MKINFKQFLVYTSLDKTELTVLDVAKDLADGIYKTALGIDAHALALKIYNSQEADYSISEVAIVENYANKFCTPFFIDALNSVKDKEQEVIEPEELN